VAFCKRKRGFLKKAIELSELCAQDIYLLIAEKDKSRIIEFKSNDSFGMKTVYECLKNNTPEVYEKFTNLDFDRLVNQDFRSVRYRKE
jgi:hypothetical protein